MLVEPLVRRRDDAVGLPIATPRRRALGPQQRIAVALEDDNLRPGGVAVRLLVAPDGELRDMGDQRAAADLENSGAIADAAPFARYDVQIVDVRDEVDVPEALLVDRPVAGKVVFLAVEAVAKEMRAVEDELVVVEEVHHQRRGGESDEARRAVAAAVVKARPGVERDREETPALPFESPPRAALLPNLRRAVAVEDEHELLVEMSLGLELAAGRDLADIRVVGVASAFEVDDRAFPAFPRPGRERDLVHVGDEERARDRHALFLDPALVRRFAVEQRP